MPKRSVKLVGNFRLPRYQRNEIGNAYHILLSEVVGFDMHKEQVTDEFRSYFANKI